MIYGVVNNKVTNAEEYLIDLELRKGQLININRNLIDISIKFDNQDVDAFILDAIKNKLIIQLVLPLKDKFDDTTNVYKNSYVRKLLNSTKFLSRFNKEFIEHIKPTKVHTEDYTTVDKLWLLSHEEISKPADFLKTNDNCWSFDMFEHVDMRRYSEMLLKLNNQKCCGWRLRSAYSDTFYSINNSYVGCVYSYGGVSGYDADFTGYGAWLPACTIC